MPACKMEVNPWCLRKRPRRCLLAVLKTLLPSFSRPDMGHSIPHQRVSRSDQAWTDNSERVAPRFHPPVPTLPFRDFYRTWVAGPRPLGRRPDLEQGYACVRLNALSCVGS